MKRKLEPMECAAGERGGDREEPLLRSSDDLEQAMVWRRKVSKNLDWMDDDLISWCIFPDRKKFQVLQLLATGISPGMEEI